MLHAVDIDICTWHPVKNSKFTLRAVEQDRCTLQGYLAHKKHHPCRTLVALCLGTYSDPRGVGVFF